MFLYKTTVRLHQTDAAGLLFFARQLDIAHDCYEQWLESVGFSFRHIILESDFFVPIVHIESDYKKALFAGDELVVQMITESIGTSSFTLGYQIIRPIGEIVGAAKTVHVCIDRNSRAKKPLAEKFRAALESNRSTPN